MTTPSRYSRPIRVGRRLGKRRRISSAARARGVSDGISFDLERVEVGVHHPADETEDLAIALVECGVAAPAATPMYRYHWLGLVGLEPDATSTGMDLSNSARNAASASIASVTSAS